MFTFCESRNQKWQKGWDERLSPSGFTHLEGIRWHLERFEPPKKTTLTTQKEMIMGLKWLFLFRQWMRKEDKRDSFSLQLVSPRRNFSRYITPYPFLSLTVTFLPSIPIQRGGKWILGNLSFLSFLFKPEKDVAFRFRHGKGKERGIFGREKRTMTNRQKGKGVGVKTKELFFDGERTTITFSEQLSVHHQSSTTHFVFILPFPSLNPWKQKSTHPLANLLLSIVWLPK